MEESRRSNFSGERTGRLEGNRALDAGSVAMTRGTATEHGQTNKSGDRTAVGESSGQAVGIDKKKVMAMRLVWESSKSETTETAYSNTTTVTVAPYTKTHVKVA